MLLSPNLAPRLKGAGVVRKVRGWDAREVIELIEAEGRKAVAIPGDIKDERFCEDLVETAVDKLGGLDILVNNAGKQKTEEKRTREA